MTIHEFQPAMAARAGSEQLLTVKDLRVTFGTHDGDVTAVNDLNFSLRAVRRWALSVSPVPASRKPPLP